MSTPTTTVGSIYVSVYDINELTADTHLGYVAMRCGPVCLLIHDNEVPTVAGRLRSLADKLDPVTVPA